jgi:hypothetical protein
MVASDPTLGWRAISAERPGLSGPEDSIYCIDYIIHIYFHRRHGIAFGPARRAMAALAERKRGGLQKEMLHTGRIPTDCRRSHIMLRIEWNEFRKILRPCPSSPLESGGHEHRENP